MRVLFDNILYSISLCLLHFQNKPLNTLHGVSFCLFFLNTIYGSRCCKYLRMIRLMDCMRCDLEKVLVFNEQDSIVTLELRRNNFTWIDVKTIPEYESLNVIDQRQNPLLCSKIKLSKVEIKSD